MRNFVAYLLLGVAAVLALDAVAPPVGLGLAVGAWPSIPDSFVGQVVDRTHKADQLQVPLTTGRQMSPPRTPAILVGCEPVFSSLSASSRANFSGRCLS